MSVCLSVASLASEKSKSSLYSPKRTFFMSSINILGLEASTNNCSVALNYSGIIEEVASLSEIERSQKLLTMIEKLLNQVSMTTDELTALAFGAGPGSFTGLKIASCVIQALSLIYKKPIIKISTLWALALQAHEQFGATLIMPCIDAKMGQIYYGIYKFDPSADPIPLPIQEDALAKPEEVELLEQNLLVIGDGANILQQKIQLSLGTTLKVESTNIYPKAASIVKLASYLYKKYGIISNNTDPIYLRLYD